MKPHRKTVSIGPLCLAAQTLVDVNRRTEAYPFDWIFSNLHMVQDCIETEFATLLDRRLIQSSSNRSSTHIVYGSSSNPVFNHHDLASDDAAYDAYRRRSSRFMEALKNEDLTLLYMTKHEEWERCDDASRLNDFCAFIERASPNAIVLVVVLCKTGGNEFDR